ELREERLALRAGERRGERDGRWTGHGRTPERRSAPCAGRRLYAGGRGRLARGFDLLPPGTRVKFVLPSLPRKALRAWTAIAGCACGTALHAQTAPAPPSPEELRKQRLFVLAREATDSNDKTRLAAWEELLRFGDDGVAKLKTIVTAKLDHDRRALEEWI